MCRGPGLGRFYFAMFHLLPLEGWDVSVSFEVIGDGSCVPNFEVVVGFACSHF